MRASAAPENNNARSGRAQIVETGLLRAIYAYSAPLSTFGSAKNRILLQRQDCRCLEKVIAAKPMRPTLILEAHLRLAWPNLPKCLDRD